MASTRIGHVKNLLFNGRAPDTAMQFSSTDTDKTSTSLRLYAHPREVQRWRNLPTPSLERALRVAANAASYRLAGDYGR